MFKRGTGYFKVCGVACHCSRLYNLDFDSDPTALTLRRPSETGVKLLSGRYSDIIYVFCQSLYLRSCASRMTLGHGYDIIIEYTARRSATDSFDMNQNVSAIVE